MRDPVSAILADKGQRVHTVPPEVTVAEAVERMNQEKIGCLVIFREGRIHGIFTERDVLVRVVAHSLDPVTAPVSDVMTADVEVIDPATRVEEAMVLITDKRCRHLPVVDDGELVGMVSIGDLTRWVVRHQRRRIADLEDYIQGAAAGPI